MHSTTKTIKYFLKIQNNVIFRQKRHFYQTFIFAKYVVLFIPIIVLKTDFKYVH